MLLGAVFELLPHGGDIAQVGNDLGDDLDDVVDLLHSVILSNRQAQRAVRYLVRQAEREQNVAGVERAGGACRTGRCADTLCVEQEQEAFALDALKAHVHSAGNVVLERAVYLGMGDLAQLGKELVSHGDDLCGVFLHVFDALLECGRKCDDAGDVLGAGTLAALLSAALDDVEQRQSALCVQYADTLGRMELVTRHTEQVDVHFLHVHGNVTHCLNRIGMEKDAVGMGDAADFGDGLDGACLLYTSPSPRD